MAEQEQVPEYEKFDLAAWREQGESQLRKLQERASELEVKLGEIRAKAEEVEVALGLRKSPAPGGKSKVMIRGFIKQVLMENEAPEAHLTQDEVIKAVQNLKVGSSGQAIGRSLERLVKTGGNFGRYVSNEITFYHYGPNTNEKSSESNGKDVSAPNLVQGG